MLRLATVALALLVPVVASAQQPRTNYAVFGIGTKTCGYWTETRKVDNYANVALIIWLAGYMTAFDLHGTDKMDGSNGADMDGLEAWIDNYCKANPLRTIANAAEALTYELRNPPNQAQSLQ